MAIIINIDVMLAKRKMSVTELSEKVGITMANISVLKNGRAKAVKLDTLNKICRTLDCQPGDLFEYVPDGNRELFSGYAPKKQPEECKAADLDGRQKWEG